MNNINIMIEIYSIEIESSRNTHSGLISPGYKNIVNKYLNKKSYFCFLYDIKYNNIDISDLNVTHDYYCNSHFKYCVILFSETELAMLKLSADIVFKESNEHYMYIVNYDNAAILKLLCG